MTERVRCERCPLRNGGDYLLAMTCNYDPPNGYRPCVNGSNSQIIKPQDIGKPDTSLPGRGSNFRHSRSEQGLRLEIE